MDHVTPASARPAAAPAALVDSWPSNSESQLRIIRVFIFVSIAANISILVFRGVYWFGRHCR